MEEEKWYKMRLENTTGPRVVKGLTFLTKEFGWNSVSSISPGNLGPMRCTYKVRVQNQAVWGKSFIACFLLSESWAHAPGSRL